MSLRLRRPLSLLLVAAAPTFGACTSYTAVHQHVVTQAALVPPASGPRAVGPTLEPAEVALSGGITWARVEPSGQARSEGESGHVVARQTVHGRLGVGAGGGFEVGAAVDVAFGSWGQPVASDVRLGELDGSTLIGVGGDMRWVPPGDGVRLGLSLETTLLQVPVRRRTETRVTPVAGDAPSPWSTTSVEREGDWAFTGGPGVFALLPITDDLVLSPGVTARLVPRYFGRRASQEVCQHTEGSEPDCTGRPPDEIEPSESAVLGTGWVGIAADLDGVRLSVTAWGSFGDERVRRTAPAGADLAVGVAF